MVSCGAVAIPITLLVIDSLGRKWALGLDFLGASICCFLAQICSSHTAYLTVTLFGVRAFISGVFNVTYIYTSEVMPVFRFFLPANSPHKCQYNVGIVKYFGLVHARNMQCKEAVMVWTLCCEKKMMIW